MGRASQGHVKPCLPEQNMTMNRYGFINLSFVLVGYMRDEFKGEDFCKICINLPK